jgi:hypothetical protein
MLHSEGRGGWVVCRLRRGDMDAERFGMQETCMHAAAYTSDELVHARDMLGGHAAEWP